MRAINRHTGSPIIGTYEHCPGVALLDPTSVTFDDDGQIDFSYAGTTDFWDDAQVTVRNKAGRRIFVDADHNLVGEDDITLEGEEPCLTSTSSRSAAGPSRSSSH